MKSKSIVNVHKCDNIIVYLLYLLFQENKSFGVRTICIINCNCTYLGFVLPTGTDMKVHQPSLVPRLN